MKIVRTVRDLRQSLEAPQAHGIVGLVPTMGALHDGHVALLQAARRECGIVVASLFVNPTQFGDAADLQAYPRDEASDARIAESAGVDLLFAPAVDEVYKPGHATWVNVDGVALGLEGEFRPGHFRGVATVCLKLFLMVAPHRAYFGQKDAQQVAVVAQMIKDLDVNLELRVIATVRAPDGLALSSRNARLSAAERARALAIPRALDAGLRAARAGADPVAAARAELGALDVDYVAVANFNGHPTLALAARAGRTRLIDNVRLDDDDLAGVLNAGPSRQGESQHGQ
ncbi:MAG TPA: pantoate--beta-alanine ligase [Vicinamibacterales bacterium]|nr:pantoate--beta-alanine ligase [Vicinamibacterales bacterium]